MVKWINTAGDVLTALACFALVASLLYLARKYRVKRLSGVFFAFALLFFSFGLRAACAAVLWWHEAGWLVNATTALRLSGAVCVALCAFITGRCAGRAFFWLRELSILERDLARAVADKRGAAAEVMREAEARHLFGQLSELARKARELTTAPGGEL